jgi:hypothetical protein
VDVDDALAIDFDGEAGELSPGSQSSALSLAEEAVQLGDVVRAQREPGHQRLLSVSRRLSYAASGAGQLPRESCSFAGVL